jgi:hypothetical protein
MDHPHHDVPTPLEVLAAAVAAAEAMRNETEEDLRDLPRWRVRERMRLQRRLARRVERQRSLAGRLARSGRSERLAVAAAKHALGEVPQMDESG